VGNLQNKQLIKLLAEEFNEEKRYSFESYGEEGRYTQRQKDYAFELIDEYGIRATTRILRVPRRTLQRWCRKHYVWVKRCPSWVYDWAERRRKRREFWQRRGYY
jgi:transposase-like protein